MVASFLQDRAEIWFMALQLTKPPQSWMKPGGGNNVSFQNSYELVCFGGDSPYVKAEHDDMLSIDINNDECGCLKPGDCCIVHDVSVDFEVQSDDEFVHYGDLEKSEAEFWLGNFNYIHVTIYNSVHDSVVLKKVKDDVGGIDIDLTAYAEDNIVPKESLRNEFLSIKGIELLSVVVELGNGIEVQCSASMGFVSTVNVEPSVWVYDPGIGATYLTAVMKGVRGDSFIERESPFTAG
ncbi:OLC1v1008435C1 [Oldenlandia corymbosa var. corymbosa]|uniref:OLC1v1008435C1 n=1 Tax=Oldenlandia corymbosa var. corymbosa TaxID=529605 RepID=A0AAV1DM50_OLDCO|nr:OLC1v1008435C1 [Oldenlandia corymbosa var. corymbosa]